MSDQQYFISPGGHLRSSQNDLELPSDPIDSGSSNPDVERSSTTMTHRGLRRRPGSVVDSPALGDDLPSEEHSAEEVMAAPNPVKKTEHPPTPPPPSPPLRHSRTRPKPRTTSVYVDGPNSEPSAEDNKDGQAVLDGNDMDDATSTFQEEEEDDDEYELPESNSDSDNSIVTEMKRSTGRSKASLAGPRTLQRKPGVPAKLAVGKTTRRKPQPKKKPISCKPSDNPSRTNKPKGGAEPKKGAKSQSISGSTLPPPQRTIFPSSATIPNPQPTEIDTQPKYSGRMNRVAKKPFYDESTGSQRKLDPSTQATSIADSELQTEKPKPEILPLETPANLLTQENKLATRKKRGPPIRKQSEPKRPKIGDYTKTRAGVVVPTLRNTTKSEQSSDSDSKGAIHVEKVMLGVTVDSTSRPSEKEDPWEIYTTPMSTKPQNSIDQADEGGNKIQRQSQTNTSSLQVAVPKKRSPVQYGLRGKSSKRIAQLAPTTLGNESDDQGFKPKVSSKPPPTNPSDDPTAQVSEPFHRNVLVQPETLVENSIGTPVACESGLPTSTKNKLKSPIVVSTDPGSGSSGLEDKEHELSDAAPVTHVSPFRPISRKPGTVEEQVSHFTTNYQRGTTMQSTHSHDGPYSQALTIQGYSPVTSPRDHDNQETEMKKAQFCGSVNVSTKQPNEIIEQKKFGTKEEPLTSLSQVPKIPVVKPLCLLNQLAQPKEVTSENQTSRVYPYMENGDTGNNLLFGDHKAIFPETKAGTLRSHRTIQHLPGHPMVGPSGSPLATRKRIDFPRNIEEVPNPSRLSERMRYRQYDDPFIPSPPGGEEIGTRTLNPQLDMFSGLDPLATEQKVHHHHHNHEVVERGPLQWPNISSSSSLPGIRNGQEPTMKIEHRKQVSKHPISRTVQFHPKSMAFASKASQAFHDVDGKSSLQQDASFDNMNESTMNERVSFPTRGLGKPGGVSIPIDPGKQNNMIKQPSKWERAVDAACTGVADTMHQTSLKILGHLRTREENLENVLDEYNRNASKIISRLAARQDIEHISTTKAFCQVCSNTATIYTEASRNALIIQNDARVHSQGSSIALWKKKSRHIEQAIKMAQRDELNI
ncbi:hypothetical protein F4775DRAFT_590591 [Biscogniauxia sp. FL1348]|nr:hypothetical protein F4775DRAFT_590591 [Biscogniauxia sp. FL1348]